MNYEQFLEKVKEDLQAGFDGGTPLGMPGIKVGIQEVEKLQGETYLGISIGRTDSEMVATLNLEDAFQDYGAGQPYQAILSGIRGMATAAVEQGSAIGRDDFHDYEALKPKLMVQLIPKKGNEGQLVSIPYKDVEDMAMIYRLDLGEGKGGRMTSVITDRTLEMFGITAEQLHKDAMENAPVSHPASLRSLADMMSDLTGMEMPPNPPGTPEIYVATTEETFLGAAVIQYPGFLEQAAEKAGGDVFVLPSSIHEVLLVPDNGGINFRDFEEMVQSVNETEVMPKDRLSDKVYHYDKEAGIFELAEKTEARRRSRQAERQPRPAGGRDGKLSVLGQLEEKKKEAEHAPKPKTHARKAERPAL